jgi:peptidoglycan/xylan/chitin deacetylase (PgdA/CDA1 family)
LFRHNVLGRSIGIVLTYHSISSAPGAYYYTVKAKTFEKHIKYIKKHFKIVTLERIVNCVMNHEDANMDLLSITFDDGYEDNFTTAYPLLGMHNVPATIFVVSGWIGQVGKLTEDQLLSMAENNITIGGHTVTHKILSQVSLDVARDEIVNSKKQLETVLNRPVNYFAYPHGTILDFNDSVAAIVADSGFKAAFTTMKGLVSENDNILKIRRFVVLEDPLFMMKLRLSGIFDTRICRYLNACNGRS